MKIDEARSGYLNLAQQGAGRQRSDQCLRQFTRIASGCFRQAHGEIAGEVTMAGIASAFQLNGGYIQFSRERACWQITEC